MTSTETTAYGKTLQQTCALHKFAFEIARQLLTAINQTKGAVVNSRRQKKVSVIALRILLLLLFYCFQFYCYQFVTVLF